MLDSMISLHQALDDAGIVTAIIGLAIVAWNQKHQAKNLAIAGKLKPAIAEIESKLAAVETVTDKALDRGQEVLDVMQEAQTAFADGALTRGDLDLLNQGLIKVKKAIDARKDG